MDKKPKKKSPAFKLVIIGDSGVGKSSIIQYFATQTFSPKYDTTVGTDFISKQVKIDDNLSITLQIWDTAGQECFRSLIKSFYQGSSAFFVIYDVTNHESYANVNIWLNEISENCGSDPIKVLVGNKNDLSGREVSAETAEIFIKERNIDLFFETSAMKGEKINEVFNETAKLILLRELKKGLCDEKEINLENSLKNEIITAVKLRTEETKNVDPIKKSSCC